MEVSRQFEVASMKRPRGEKASDVKGGKKSDVKESDRDRDRAVKGVTLASYPGENRISKF